MIIGGITMEEYVVTTEVLLNRYYLVKANSTDEAQEKWFNRDEDADYVDDVFDILRARE